MVADAMMPAGMTAVCVEEGMYGGGYEGRGAGVGRGHEEGEVCVGATPLDEVAMAT